MRALTHEQFDQAYPIRRVPGTPFESRNGALWGALVALLKDSGPTALEPDDYPGSVRQAQHRINLEGRIQGVRFQTTVQTTDLGSQELWVRQVMT